MRHIRPLSAVLLLGMTLALAACGGGGNKSADQPKGDIEDQLGFDQAGILARQSRVEADIRDCMKNQGFDYVPVDPVAQRAALFGSSRLSDLDFAKQFGYGISTLWGHVSATADPNLRMRASLSPADRRAYDRALGGDNPGGTFTAAVDTGDFTKLGGCTLKGTEQVFGGAQVLSQLSSKLDQLEERIFQDQRLVRAVEKWSSCMSKAGYQYEEPEAIDSDLFKRTEQIVGPVPGQFATGPEPGVKPPPYDHAALAQLQRDEVSIAVADYDCEHKYITGVEEVVRTHYQNQFRQENRSLIAQVKPVR
ncbi:MAG: hypothetical protein E6G10_09230 [Actinobacteria bacterium]|nr:MAG: hypothetical protein E6G10_09230 [Actinomycetota bacterium]